MWKPLQHPMISNGYLISDKGHVRNKDCDESEYLSADYHSSNGYDFIMLIVKEEYRINNSLFMLFPIDELLGMTFIPIPKELKDKPITIKHINGDTRDITLDNLQWIEDIEEWRECTYPNIKPGLYEVSSWGRVRNKKYKNMLRPALTKKGYFSTVLRNDSNGQITTPTHRLIRYQFDQISEYKKYQVNHINGNKTNNHYKNLEWCLNSANNKHAEMLQLVGRRPSKIKTEEIDMVIGLLLKYDKPMIVFNNINHDEFPNITLDVIRDIRRGRKTYFRSNKYDLKEIVFNKIDNKPPTKVSKITVDDMDFVRMVLMNNNGSLIKTFRTIKNSRDDISYNIICGIKRGVKTYSKSNIFDLTKGSKYPWKE